MATSTTQTGNAEQEARELFLLHLRYKASRLRDIGNNQPILLDDADTAWVVYTGEVHIFAVQLQNGKPAGGRRYLGTMGAGQALFGITKSAQQDTVGLLAVGLADTRILQIKRARLIEVGANPEYHEQVVRLVESWVTSLSNSITYDIPPKDCQLLRPEITTEVNAYASIRAPRGILWVTVHEGLFCFNGRTNAPLEAGSTAFPLPSRSWITATEPGSITGIETSTWMSTDQQWDSLDYLHHLVLQQLVRHLDRQVAVEEEWFKRRAEADRQTVAKASYQLAVILDKDKIRPFDETGTDDPLLAACRLVGNALGVEIKPLPISAAGHRDPLEEIARVSRVNLRQVTLTRRWWHSDAGPLLGYLRDRQQPVALLPVSSTSYEIYNPADRSRRLVTEQVASKLAPRAHMFYRSFPDHPLSALDLLRFGLRGSSRDLQIAALLGVIGGLIALMIPIATGIIFDTYIPLGAQTQILQIAVSLIVVALVGALFQTTRSLALLRVETRMDLALQSALWSRLLTLPMSFFRNYSAGDLANRAMGISAIKQMLSGLAVSTITTAIFSLFSLALLFFYDVTLAFVALGLVAVFAFIALIVTSRQLKYERQMADQGGIIHGTVLQLLTGIAKVRAAGAEERAFARWAEQFSIQRRYAFQARTIGNWLEVLQAAFPVLVLMALFATVHAGWQDTFSPGTFIAITAAFTQFLLALFSTIFVLRGVLGVVPTFERLQPLLKTRPEVDTGKADPGELQGAIEMNHVSFRYTHDGPLVLEDFSLSISPGEFVAIVGPSGSGKSTLFRLLMGFETPVSGTIYYDSQDLDSLDIQAVRGQIGIVLQNHHVQAGDLFSNIIGVSRLTLDEAWEAARLVGLADEIRQMPMGMHTVVSEGGTTLSGGQKQRLAIARAIVTRPRVLFFDEATSALDNRTQQLVSDSLERLQATRIVVAHRLSTIRGADRIVVLEHGRIVQTGTYDDLMNEAGPFRTLAARQLA